MTVRNKTKQKSKYKLSIIRCPLGGRCYNPMCLMFGCVND